MTNVDKIIFTMDGLKDYIYWQTEDKRTLKKINNLINDIIRNGNKGVGHPEELKDNLSGKWSRKIDDKNRLVYQIFEDGKVEIYQCRGHYDDR